MSTSELTERANSHERRAMRYAAGLVDKMCVPHTYDEAVTMVAVAYLEGSIAELEQSRDLLIGDTAETVGYRAFLRCVPDARTDGGAA